MRSPSNHRATVVLTVLLGLPATVRAIDDHPAPDPSPSPKTRGNASFYAKHFAGRKTASGARYDPQALTAAHRTLPLGTQVKVTNPKNDRSVVVMVNDRGPGPKSRIIDVSSAAADALDMKRSGVTQVRTEVVGRTDPARPEPAADQADARSR